MIAIFDTSVIVALESIHVAVLPVLDNMEATHGILFISHTHAEIYFQFMTAIFDLPVSHPDVGEYPR